MQYQIYHTSPDNKARYLLGTGISKPPAQTILCVGVNPSTASPLLLDPTVSRVEQIALHNGYSQIIMCNLYPQRATNPDDLHRLLRTDYHRENLKQMEGLFQQGCVNLWAAWGTLIEKRNYLTDCLLALLTLSEEYPVHWYATKVTKKGHPYHPLYQKKTSLLVPYDISHYLG